MQFQSTLPRRERRKCGQKLDWSDEISIHAPAKGATVLTVARLWKYQISIHAPAKGATTADRTAAESTTDFNPRSREGSDNKNSKIISRSINFNPRSREGSDDKR